MQHYTRTRKRVFEAVTAALPPQPLPKSNASADFLAMLLTVKFVDGLPLARFEYVLNGNKVLRYYVEGQQCHHFAKRFDQ